MASCCHDIQGTHKVVERTIVMEDIQRAVKEKRVSLDYFKDTGNH